MKILKFFILITGIVGYATNLQASKTMPKAAAPLIKKSLGIGTTATLTSQNLTQSQGAQLHTKQYTPYNTPTYTKVKIPVFTPYKQAQPLAKPLQITDTFQEPTYQAISQPDDVTDMNTKNQLKPIQQTTAQSLHIQPQIIYQKPVGTNFAFKGIPQRRTEITKQPDANQLLLTYDPDFIATVEETPIKPMATKKSIITEKKQSQKYGDQENKEELFSSIEAPQEEETTIQKTQQKIGRLPAKIITKQQKLDSEQAELEETLVKSIIASVDELVENWPFYRQEHMTDLAYNRLLTQEVLKIIEPESADPDMYILDIDRDIKIIDKLLQKYQNQPTAQKIFTTVKKRLQDQFASQSVASRQASNVIARYYRPDMRESIFAIIPTTPQFNLETGQITNMPSATTIINIAIDNPSAQSFKALQTCLQATKVAIKASSSMADTQLIDQLKTTEQKITAALADEAFKPYQSWGTYAMSLLPSAKTLLQSTGAGNIKLNTVIDSANSITNAIGNAAENLLPTSVNASIAGAKNIIKNTTISQLLDNSGYFKKSTPITNLKEPENSFEINIQHQADEALSGYYTPAMVKDIFAVAQTKPIVNPSTGIITNMPSVSAMAKSALLQPTQEKFNALQSMLQATDVAIYANQDHSTLIGDRAFLETLKTYQSYLKTILQDSKFKQFQSWTTQATDYASSFLPSTETIVKTTLQNTGIGNLTVDDINFAGKAAYRISGIGNKTFNQIMETGEQLYQNPAGVALATAQNAAQSAFNATGIPTAFNNVSQGIKNTAQNVTAGVASALQAAPQAGIAIA